MATLVSCTKILSDYGENIGAGSYWHESPDCLAELETVVSVAAQSKKCIRLRGNGHSMNASSLPREGELLIDMRRMSHYVFESSDTVTVDAGVAVWDVNLMLKQYGYVNRPDFTRHFSASWDFAFRTVPATGLH